MRKCATWIPICNYQNNKMEYIEEHLKDLIFRDVEFVLDEKVLRKGKVEIYNTKQNFVKFKIEIDDKTKEWEIAFPYRIEKTNHGYIFDYTLSAFCPPTQEVYWAMKALDKSKSSKFFDNYLYVNIT